MKSLYILCGPPGSGKSTWAKGLKRAKIISRDKIRFSMLKDDDEYFSHESKVYTEFIAQIKKAIYSRDISYDIVIADATHLNYFSRTKLLKHIFDDATISENNLLEHNLPVYTRFCYFNTSLEICLERNNKRCGRQKVPEDDLIRMYNIFTKPPQKTIIMEIW